jgi:hypothetical protein
MNMLNIGMDMSQILLPQMQQVAYYNVNKGDNQQINSSSIYSYLNQRGLGSVSSGYAVRKFNAIPYLGYWDIYKNYYANKQEERGFVIHAEKSNAFKVLSADVITTNSQGTLTGLSPYSVEGSGYATVDTSLTTAYAVELVVYVKSGDVVEGLPLAEDIKVKIGGGIETFAVDEFDENTVGGLINGSYAITFRRYNGVRAASQSWQVAQTVVLNNIPDGEGLPQLKEFPLDNIDDMRMDILEAVRDVTAFTINENTAAPYGLGLGWTGSLSNEAKFYKLASQEGLGIKTYQSDLFNNWISTEWIDGSNGINEVTAVSTAGDEFTIDSLNLANKVYNMLNRIAISGGSYDDWLDAVYTHE